MPKAVRNAAESRRLLYLRGVESFKGVSAKELIEEIDPENDGKQTGQTPVYLVAPRFNRDVLATILPRDVNHTGRNFFMQQYASPEGRKNLYPLLDPLGSIVRREYAQAGISGFYFIPAITVATQHAYDIAKTSGLGHIIRTSNRWDSI